MSDLDQNYKPGYSSFSYLALFASSTTLVCCALPALFVALGAGASLVTLLGMFPILIEISKYKVALSILAGTLILLAIYVNFKTSKMPCPTDPDLAQACMKTRRLSQVIVFGSGVIFIVGSFFTYIAPNII